MSRKIAAKLVVLASVILLGGAGTAPAQQPKAKGPARAAQATPSPGASPAPAEAAPNTPPQPGWVARCASASREAPLECAITESAFVTKTGQLLAQINIRVASDTHAPIALLQLPLGLN